MKAKPIYIDQLRAQLSLAQERLALEKNTILKLDPLRDPITLHATREAYAFAYVRAERLGMHIINLGLSELSWLPMQLDTRTEMMSEDRGDMKRWLKATTPDQPNAAIFGNDFMHALTRCAMQHGWEEENFTRLALRIAELFRELSCLIGVAYYCNWLAENNLDQIMLSNPDDLNQTAIECAAFIRSPDLHTYLRAPEQNNHTASATAKPAKTMVRARPPRQRAELYVIQGSGGFQPDPVPAT